MNKKLIFLIAVIAQIATTSFGMFDDKYDLHLYKHNPDPNWQLFFAATSGNLTKVKELLSEGADPSINLKCDTFDGPISIDILERLFFKKNENAPKIIKLLIGHGAKPNKELYAGSLTNEFKNMLSYVSSISKEEKKSILKQKPTILCALWALKQKKFPKDVCMLIFNLIIKELQDSHFKLRENELTYIVTTAKNIKDETTVEKLDANNPESLISQQVRNNICEVLFAPEQKNNQ